MLFSIGFLLIIIIATTNAFSTSWQKKVDNQNTATNKRKHTAITSEMSYSSGGRGGYGGRDGRGGGGRGRGEYYKNKYGGRGRSGRGGRGGRDSGGRGQILSSRNGGGTYEEFKALLRSLDNSSYPGYKNIESTKGWTMDGLSGFNLYIGRAQSDPYAPPTRCRIVVPNSTAGFPKHLYHNKIRAIALADFVHREFYSLCLDLKADRAADTAKGGWSGPKGGNISIESPTQHVIEQSAVSIDTTTGNVIAQFSVNLPARGRTILGMQALEIFEKTIPSLVKKSLMHHSLDQIRCNHHVLSVEDQDWLRRQLKTKNYVAFVPNGAILPRASGSDDRPMKSKNSNDKVISFESPESLKVSFELPNLKRTIHGMGLRSGINLIVGGGFHGKSTLLSALQFGIYDKIPGDGREFCVCDASAVKIRAEDGRAVTAVDISPFINHLPFGKTTSNFSTADASGSTSQATNIIESLEIGSKLLLLDEDVCATNAMIRDTKMMELVCTEKEPITPFIYKVGPLYNDLNVSTILVVGGSGDYFGVATTVIMMDCYRCKDVTVKAKAIAEKYNDNINVQLQSEMIGAPFGSLSKRYPQPEVFHETNKVSVRSESLISYGETELDLRYLEQIISKSQTCSISGALRKISSFSSRETKTIKEVVDEILKQVDSFGLDALSPDPFNGSLAYTRPFEIAAAINRLRRENSIVQKE